MTKREIIIVSTRISSSNASGRSVRLRICEWLCIVLYVWQRRYLGKRAGSEGIQMTSAFVFNYSTPPIWDTLQCFFFFFLFKFGFCVQSRAFTHDYHDVSSPVPLGVVHRRATRPYHVSWNSDKLVETLWCFHDFVHFKNRQPSQNEMKRMWHCVRLL